MKYHVRFESVNKFDFVSSIASNACVTGSAVIQARHPPPVLSSAQFTNTGAQVIELDSLGYVPEKVKPQKRNGPAF